VQVSACATDGARVGFRPVAPDRHCRLTIFGRAIAPAAATFQHMNDPARAVPDQVGSYPAASK
jgi:hypothetical protein